MIVLWSAIQPNNVGQTGRAKRAPLTLNVRHNLLIDECHL
jgi:hypothetical protein